MIKFFRNIRFSLMERNKTGKYFKYTIGEIILVLIGILIALQINHWNESRKQKQQTRTNILSIAKDISNDTVLQQRIIKSLKKEVTAGELLIPIMESEQQIIQDSLDFILKFNDLTTVYVIPDETNTWSLLKSSGVLSEFPDAKLLNMLQDYYNSYFNLSTNFSNSANESRLEIRKLKYELFSDSDHKKFFPTNTPKAPSKKAFEAIFNDEKILPLCRFIRGGAFYFEPKFELVNKKAHDIINYIHKNYKPIAS
jgi:hypothetical protein